MTAAAATGGVRAISPTLHVTADNTDVDHSDPALSYSTLGWQIEYETCVPLLGYSDVGGTAVGSELEPVGAAGMPVVANGGKTYVFRIKSGFRFSDGAALTAENYEYAIERDRSRTLNSPATAFIQDVRGVTVSGSTLTIQLRKPDGSLLPRLAMPFFCPIEKAPPFFVGGKWVDTEVTGPYPAPGPYYLSQRDVGQDLVLRRNPYYTGPRPHRSSQIVIDVNTTSTDAYAGISNGTYAADLNGNPEPSLNRQLANEFGIDRSRLWVHPELETTYVKLNTNWRVFRSAAVRRAVNYAIDRPALIKIGGYLTGSPTSQILPEPLTGGVYKQNLYPVTPPGKRRFEKAKRMSHDCGQGHRHPLRLLLGGGSAANQQEAAIVGADLHRMGCRVKSFYIGGRFIGPGSPPIPVDLAILSWVDDYPDGYDFMIPLLGLGGEGDNLTDLTGFRNKAVSARVARANALSGAARAKAWGELDQWVMTKYAPWAPIENDNVVDYLSPNAGGYAFDAPFGSIDLGDLYQS